MLDSLTLVTCYLVKWRANIASAISRLLQDKMEELISVKDFGAVGDGVTDDHLAIQAAIGHAETLPQVDVFPYAPVKLLFPAGVYRHTKPFRVTKPIQLVGDGVQIKAMAPYSTIPIDKQGGGVTNFSGQFAVVSGKIGANTLEGTLRWGFSICRGIMLDAADTAMSNMYIERFANAVIDSPMQSSPTDGLVVGPSCWGLSSHSLSIENFNRYAIHFLKDAAVNGGKLDLRIWGNFKTGQAGLLFDADSACNGVNITGYIEKVDYGVIAAKSTGAISFDGVDFEQCTFRVLQAASLASEPRVGRISFRNCFLDSVQGAKIYASNAMVTVDGCTMYNRSNDYETDAEGTGSIVTRDCDHKLGFAGIMPGSNVSLEVHDGITIDKRNYLPTKTSFVNIPVVANYQFKDTPNTRSSYFEFSSLWDGAQSKYLSVSTWSISDFFPSTSLTRNVGVKLITDPNFGFVPTSDNLINLGLPSSRWSSVYAGTGTIQTSDMSLKTDIAHLSEPELEVAKRLRGLIQKYRFKKEKEEKAANGVISRLHVGVMAQEVGLLFKEHGLDAFDYGVLCYDEWGDEFAVVKGHKGNNETVKITSAGSRYSVRYDELTMFMLAAL